MTRPAASDPSTLARMRRQKRTGTKPEVVVRKLIRELGHAYRLNSSSMPGSPDISNRKRGWAVFVHGCYWHQHPGCRRATVPKANREWWVAKFQRTRERDARKIRDLKALGLEVLVVWECETRDSNALRRRLLVELTKLSGGQSS